MLMSSIWNKAIGLQGLSGLPVFGEVSIAGPQASTGSPVFSMVIALSSLTVDGPMPCPTEEAIWITPTPTPHLVFQILKAFQVETLRQEDVQMAYRFVLMPSSSPVLTFRPVS